MSNILNKDFKETLKEAMVIVIISIIIATIVFFAIVGVAYLVDSKQQEATGFGGYCPIKIYQIYDRDTGVYYAVTEKGGICVMETMSGETKLVEQGDGATIHPNLGESKNVD